MPTTGPTGTTTHTPFDIPHILYAITSHLSPPDIWSCCQVSTEWLTLFRPFHWRQVNIKDYQRVSRGVDLNPQQVTLFEENAKWIRELKVQSARPGLFLEQQIQCGRLEALSVRVIPDDDEDGSEFEYYENEVLEGDSVDATDRALRLRLEETMGAIVKTVQRNSLLKRLDLGLVGSRMLSLLLKERTLASFLTHHPSLKEFVLDSEGDLKRRHVATLLKSLPRSAQSVKLSLHLSDYDMEPLTGLLQDLDMDTFPAYPSLQHLDVSGCCDMTSHHDNSEDQGIPTLLFPLLERCPNLLSLKLSGLSENHKDSLLQVVNRSCPKLKGAFFDVHYPSALPLAFAQGLDQPLEGFAAGSEMESHDELVLTLAKNSGMSLQSLHLALAGRYRRPVVTPGQGQPLPPPPSATLFGGAILNSLFPNLKELTLGYHFQFDASVPCTLEELVVVQEDGHHRPWACNHTLEKLNLIIISPPDHTSNSDSNADEALQAQEDRDQTWVQQLVLLRTRLCSLPRLKSLQLTWDMRHTQGQPIQQFMALGRLVLAPKMLQLVKKANMSDADLEWMNISRQ